MAAPRTCCPPRRAALAPRFSLAALAALCAALPAQATRGLGTDARAGDGAVAELAARLRAEVPAILAESRVPGLSIALIRERRIAWQGAFGVRVAGKPEKVTDDTVFEAASMSKPLFAYAVLRLVEQGRLDLDRSLDEYLAEPYLPDQPLASKITARMVLVHTTGLPNWRAGGYRRGGPVPVRFEPGTRYGYSGEGFLYLQTAVEQVTGERLSELMWSRLLEPLGMRRSSYLWQKALADDFAGGHDRGGEPKTGRGLYERGNAAFTLYTTAGDYGRFLVEMMREDRSAEHSLSAVSIASMTTAQLDREVDGKRVVRALGWGLDLDTGWVEHGGSNGSGFKSRSRFDPARGCGAVIMTNSAGGDRAWRAVLDLIDRPR